MDAVSLTGLIICVTGVACLVFAVVDIRLHCGYGHMNQVNYQNEFGTTTHVIDIVYRVGLFALYISGYASIGDAKNILQTIKVLCTKNFLFIIWYKRRKT